MNGPRLAAYQPPATRQNQSVSGGRRSRTTSTRREPDGIRSRRMWCIIADCGAVNRVAQDRDQLRVRVMRLHPLGDELRVVPPDHVPGRRLADDRLALPALELVAVPVGALILDAVPVVPEVHLRRRGEDVGVLPEVDAQPARRTLLRTDDDERRKRAALARSGDRFGRQLRNPSKRARGTAGYPPTLGRSRGPVCTSAGARWTSRKQSNTSRNSWNACAANCARSAW